jgi:ribonuclease HII
VPSLQFEHSVKKETGVTCIAGLDEAGRGALAGPVVAAAVILPLDLPQRLKALDGVNDSKQLTAKTRERLYSLIIANALSVGIGSTSASDIDEIGIIPSTKLAMLSALDQLDPPAEFLLIDGRIRLKNISLRQQSIIRGDGKSLSIAAASILAKVTRDRIMVALDGRYPQYGFARHKGYGTEFHRVAITRLGPTPEHRMSFSPLRKTLL